ncbi:MAG: DUF6428 family protein [Bacteroidota bacterium]
MKLSDFKKKLSTSKSINFIQPDGTAVPAHFHITEVGLTSKHFIDCGGTVREEKVVSIQLWEANDFNHRLKPQKLVDIIALSEKVLGLADLEVEVEYQTNTIGRYSLDLKDNDFIMVAKQTNCLAKDNCGIPAEKLKVNLAELSNANSCCTPGGGCC